MGWKHTALRGIRGIGGLRVIEALYGASRLTVLAYHRVVDPADPEFQGFRGNVSATPAAFAAQMEWVAERMQPVTLDQVASVLEGVPLPPRSVLVTFDDGYRDNLTAAAPILAAFEVPATLFVATDHVSTGDPFWWDRVATWFEALGPGATELPVLGSRSWTAPDAIASEWIEAAKLLDHEVKEAAVEELRDVLGGDAESEAGDLLDWNEVRALHADGWSIGAHTCSHAILTRLAAEQVVAEVRDSVDRVQAEVGAAVLGFAYPNGQAGDFDGTARDAVAASGVPLAFSLVPGPARAGEFRADPYGVRRVYVHHGDDDVRFAAKAAGVPRLLGVR